jgi:hypothetical protein
MASARCGVTALRGGAHMLRFSVGRTLNWDGWLHDGAALPSGRSYQDGYGRGG